MTTLGEPLKQGEVEAFLRDSGYSGPQIQYESLVNEVLEIRKPITQK